MCLKKLKFIEKKYWFRLQQTYFVNDAVKKHEIHSLRLINFLAGNIANQKIQIRIIHKGNML